MKTTLFEPVIHYLPDEAVNQALDAEIRALLTRCFTQPQDVVFRERRYFVEPYPHRWVTRDAAGKIIAHIGVHEKVVCAGPHHYGIGGIAEVCVHPDFRGQGLVRAMLSVIHTWLQGAGFAFSVLMGDPRVYQSSGYRSVDNLFCDAPEKGKRLRCDSAMVRSLQVSPWPDKSAVYLPGPSF